MQHVSELITQPPVASAQQTASAVSSLTERHIALLWERMAMIYGHRWTSSYGEKDDSTWRKGLADVTPDQVGIGLERCRTSGDEWPPTLPIFRGRCLLAQYAAAYHRPFPKLPTPPVDRTVAEREIAKMRAMTRPIVQDEEARAERAAIVEESK